MLGVVDKKKIGCYVFFFSIIRRSVFGVEEKSHQGHIKAVKQSVLDGTCKWSAKIAITGLFNNKKKQFDIMSRRLQRALCGNLHCAWC